MSAPAPALVRAARRPLQAAAVLALLAPAAVGTLRCDSDARIPAALAAVAAVGLLVPVLRSNRATLPFALVMGSLPSLLSLRAHRFAAYDVAFAGIALVVCAECASRAWYLNSTAPRQRSGRWLPGLVVLAALGALAAAAVMAVARVRLDGAVVLTAVGAGALVAAGLLAARTAER